MTVTEQEVLKWIADITGERPANPNSVHESLKDGILLCKLINSIRPGSIPRINTKPVKYLQIENISLFIRAAKKAGVPQHDCMSAVDLFDGSNIRQALICIESFGRICQDHFDGPTLGARRARKQKPQEMVWDRGGREAPTWTVRMADGTQKQMDQGQYDQFRKDEDQRLDASRRAREAAMKRRAEAEARMRARAPDDDYQDGIQFVPEDDGVRGNRGKVVELGCQCLLQ